MHQRDANASGLPIGGDNGENGYATPQLMPIAVTGMGCRLPGDVSRPEQLWELCCAARSAWSEVPKDRFNASAFYHPNADKRNTTHIQGGHFLSDVTHFDAQFFNITAEEAKAMDPQQRLLLEIIYEALENAGIPLHTLVNQDVGTADAILSNRISYFLGVHGPSLTVDTACSSGLTALHLACQSLRLGESSQAIVGGSHLNLLPDYLITKSNLKLLSSEGKSFAFDHRANGYGPGEGACCIVMKPLDQAIQAGDPIRAVIRNSGVNQDGRTKGLTMPSSEAQVALAESVYRAASLDPRDTSFIETHGTGTRVGDPIEAQAIKAVFTQERSSKSPLYIGSVKSNIGHLEGTSGLVAVVKAILMLEKATVLPNADFERAHPEIPLNDWNISVPTTACHWPDQKFRRISVSNFGFGGTNAHIILEEAPRTKPTESEQSLRHAEDRQVFVLTANDKESVRAYATDMIHYMEQSKKSDQAQMMVPLAFTLGQRRSTFPWRFAVSATSAAGLIDQLKRIDLAPLRSNREPIVGFVFTGQGAQWYAMGRELMETYPIFESAIREATLSLEKMGATWSLRDELLKDASSSRIGEAYLSQPACTAIQLALVLLYRSWGICPHAVVGHSSGEIAAAYAAEVLDFDACLSLAYHRGLASTALKRDHPNVKGAMLAIGANEDEAAALINRLGNEFVANIACVNSPSSVTVSGDEGAIAEIEKLAREKDYFNRRLQVGVAYHSHHMKLVMGQYRSAIGTVKAASSKTIRFCSSLTGVEVNTLVLGASYWVRNLTSPVKFAPALTRMCLSPESSARRRKLVDVLLEIGPHSALQGPIRETLKIHAEETKDICYVPSLVRKQDSLRTMQESACVLFMRGCPITLEAINTPIKQDRPPTVMTDLPPYRWKHEEKYWHESRVSRNFTHREFGRHDILGLRTIESADTEPSWRNFLSLENLPWLQDHRIQSRVTCPMSFFICMALEAANQKATTKAMQRRSYILRDIHAGKAMVVPETSEIETLISFHPSTESVLGRSPHMWDEFTVHSYTPHTGWLEHCRGCIAVKPADENEPIGGRMQNSLPSSVNEQVSKIDTSALTAVNPDQMYKMSAHFGNEIGATSQGLYDCRTGKNLAIGKVKIPNTAELMPNQVETEYIIHPIVLDTCFHLTFPMINAGSDSSGGAPIPSYIERFTLRYGAGRAAMPYYEVFGAGMKKVTTARTIESLLLLDPNELADPFLEVKNFEFKLPSEDFTGAAEEDKDFLCSEISWKPSLDLLKAAQISEDFSLGSMKTGELKNIRIVERACLSFFDKAISEISEKEVESFQGHHKKFFQWMQIKCLEAREKELPLLKEGRMDLEGKTFDEVSRAMRATGIEGELVGKVGNNLSRILRNDVETLGLLLEDDLLSRYYRTLDALERNYQEASLLIAALAHQNPNMRILEIGAGTGGATIPLVGSLGVITGATPRFQHYDFTDVSTGFFEPAKQQLDHWKGFMSFTRLDIEEDPLSQGFREGAYDLIVAANCLHATTNMKQTMTNVRKLMKPGGKLLLLEETVHSLRRFPFATLPGWWLAEEPERIEGPLLSENHWDSLLRNTGFSGIDGAVHDYPGVPEHTGSVILSTAVPATIPSLSEGIIIIASDQHPRVSLETLETGIKKLSKQPPKILSLEQVGNLDLSASYCIFLDELEKSLLSNPSPQTFAHIKNLCKSRGFLWVVQGACDGSKSPEGNLAFGLTRSIRSENDGIKAVTLDLDAQNQLDKLRTAEVICEVFRVAMVSPPFSQQSDNEFKERNGRIYIPRLVNKPEVNRYINRQIGRSAPELQDQNDRVLRLAQGTAGDLDSFYYDDDKEATRCLKDDEVEIEVKAIGVAFNKA